MKEEGERKGGWKEKEGLRKEGERKRIDGGMTKSDALDTACLLLLLHASALLAARRRTTDDAPVDEKHGCLLSLARRSGRERPINKQAGKRFPFCFVLLPLLFSSLCALREK